MNHQTSIPVGDPLRSEASTSREGSTRELQEHIISFITMLIGLLQLKQGVFDTDYLTLVSFVVALIVYGSSLIGPTYIRQAHPNSDLATLMDKISLPFGALTLVLGLVILVRVLGLALLCVWIVWFASFVANDLFMYLKTLYESAVAGVVEAFEKLKEYLKNLNMIIGRCFTMNSEDQAGLP
ncbi:hypothetical protein Pyn_18227 [Prunus yedoensis var. nudiflora]|uniref:Uncharacterized protein n=1 Tax=Prunus yedoensis var. nudiflora TaxID=2094558 RepID=A0A314Y1C6_PRUYE|nr:hypothetical protein Pyn_18227 [Prunus yedoensis var. nudiflora]